MKLIFHIGLHKTGTTAFQQICYANRAVLHDLGLIYSSYNNVGQHSILLSQIQRNGIVAFETYLDNVLADNLGASTLLISGEAFEYVMIDTHLARELEQVAKKRGFEEFEWVVVWRDAPEHLRSLYGELGKLGILVDPHTLVRAYKERGYFLATSAKFNYGFALDRARMLPRLKNAVSGSVVQMEFKDFIEGYAGCALLQRILGPDGFKVFSTTADTVVSNPNKALTPFQIEFRCVAAFRGVRRAKMNRTQKSLFVLLNLLLIRRRMRFAATAFNRFNESD